LKKEAGEIAALLAARIAVCLIDVRGAGEIRTGDDRGRTSGATSHSSTELMLGQTLIREQLHDVGYVLAWLQERKDVDAKRLAVWGSSQADVNPPDRELRVPYDVDTPKIGEPMGGLLALYVPHYWDAGAVLAEGTLKSWSSVLDSPFVWVPHDAMVPDAATQLELDEWVGSLHSRKVRIARPIDGLNRAVSQADLDAAYSLAKKSFDAAGKGKNLTLSAEPVVGSSSAWLIESLK
jgi:hypothetical protein